MYSMYMWFKMLIDYFLCINRSTMPESKRQHTHKKIRHIMIWVKKLNKDVNATYINL